MKLSSVTRQSGRISSLNKYNQSYYFILNDFCTDIVFELDNGTKISKTVFNLNLPIYSGQIIDLISIDNSIIALEDKDNNEYFYLSNNPARELGLEKITWLSVVIATIILYFLFTKVIPIKSEYVGLVFLLPLGFRVFRGFQNEYFEKKLDNLIEK
jgi:hypothetical protein